LKKYDYPKSNSTLLNNRSTKNFPPSPLEGLFLLFFSVLLLLVTSSPVNANTRTVPGETYGYYYNEVWDDWFRQPISIYVDDDGYFYFEGGEGLLKSVGFVDGCYLDDIINLLHKSLDWCRQAQEKNLEISKDLGEFFCDYDYSEQGIGLSFFSANGGQQTDVILEIKDFINGFMSIKLYVEPDQIRDLIELLKRCPTTYRELLHQTEQLN
jgi:hypothetical protein